MFLKSIEVQGFKSFANKLTFEFHKGITGIVGPNGSGKSNVADAVRWVLGEQSAKQLRGSKMEDVIFSGTENRKPLGFAYVAITLDNTDHQLAVDFDTVTVSRRVYRSGESEYKINNRNCRLKDIQELFFDTGIGKEGYSIIGQGQIDRILSGKPEERRELFDEAVGIVKYKKRKALTEKNLEEERLNLSRVKDILRELEKQVGPLERQSETAKAYLKFRDSLKAYDTNIYLLSFGELRKETAALDEKITIAANQLEDAKNAYEMAKSSYAEVEALMEQFEEKIASAQAVCNEQALQKQRLEGSRELYQSKERDVKNQIQRLMDSIRESEHKIQEYVKTELSLQQELQDISEEIEMIKASQTSSEQELTEISETVKNIREAIDQRNSDIIESLNQVSTLKAKAQRYETMYEQAQIRQSELNQRLIVLQSEESNEGELVAAFEQEAAAIALDREQLVTQQNYYQERTQKIADQLLKSRQLLSAKERSFHEAKSKYDTLKNITERYDGYGNSIRRVMERKQSNDGIIGVVADIIHVEKKYEIAIETALGGSISNIVTDNEHTAKQSIQYLKDNRYGRATFLPLTSIRGKKADRAEEICREPGVIGVASDLIQTDPQFENLSVYLLGRVFVTDHVDHALAIAKKYRYSLRIVTLEGESLNPGGSLSGGAYKNSSNLLSRHREMDELKQHVLQLKQDMQGLSEDINRLQQEKDSNKESSEKNTAELTTLSLRENTVRIRLKQVKESHEEHGRTIEEITKETQTLKMQKQELDELLIGIRKDMQDIDTEKADAESDIASLMKQLEDASEKEKNFNSQTADIRIDFANLIQKKGFVNENITRVEEEKSQIHNQIIDFQSQKAAHEQILLDVQKNLNTIENEYTELEKQILLDQASLLKDQEEKNNYALRHKTFFKQYEELAETISALDKEHFRLTSQKEKNEETRNQLSSYMWDNYGLTYGSAQELADEDLLQQPLSVLKRQTQEIKSQIKALGPVNVQAIEEYQSVSERYETLKTQHQDMIEAEEKLTGIIESLNISMEQQFKEQFGRIQKEFDKIFKRLFGGGKGTLELSDPDNLLETGVIIIAQPPGKKLQNMMQLSGGEKALTAIALLFAIQSLKPSPFCLLDEIEAALDDANVKRFAEYLHNLTKDTQFIVITHRRGTMTAADTLYGITMQEKGVSTLVSVSLIEKDL